MEDSRPPRIYKIAIMILPIGVVIGTAVFMWMYFANHLKEKNEQNVIVATGIRAGDLRDMVGKLTGLIGERDIGTEQGRAGLARAAAMIEGRLGPQNLGLRVNKGAGDAVDGRLWKSLWVDVRGGGKNNEVVIAAVSFAGAGETADANTVSTLAMLASSLAKEKPARTIRLVFLPVSRPPAQQDQWLLGHCLRSGETCAGILGLHVMHGEPRPGDPGWAVTARRPADQAWWQSVSSANQGTTHAGAEVPSVWLTHAVYATGTWKGKPDARVRATVPVARELRAWILKAAN